MNPLEKAIREDNVHQFRLLLDLGHDVNSISIYDLIKKGALKCLSYLIDKRHDVSDVELIRTFLFLKDPEETHVKILRLLLEHGATVDQDTYDPFSEPPIVTIAEKGNLNEYHIEIVELLLKSGMDPDRTDIEHFPLHTALYAILSYNRPINNIQENFAKVLIENGANIEAESPYEDTPLFWAAGANAVEIAQMLIKRGKNVNATDEYGNTPLFNAARFDAKEVAELLIANGAYINTKNIRGKTALFKCAIGNSLKVAKLLIKKGANVDERDENCKTPLFFYEKRNALDVAKQLIANGANLNAQDKDGRTPLYEAARGGNIDMAKYLISQGADSKLLDKYDRDFLWDAAMCNNHEFINVFFTYSTNPNQTNKIGETVRQRAANNKYDRLNSAIFQKDFKLVAKILKQPLDINENRSVYFRLLYNAVECYQADIFLLLLEYGADPAVLPKPQQAKFREFFQRLEPKKQQELIKANIIRSIMDSLIRSKQT